MVFRKAALAALATIAFTGQAFAWGDMYMGTSTPSQGAQLLAYGGPNNCPAGLQPVVLNGVICCGTPTGSMSYQQMMAHPMPRKARRAHTHTRTHTHQKRHSHTYRHSH